jgi:hypothetical protein
MTGGTVRDVAMPWRWRTEMLSDALELPGWSPAGNDRFRTPDGGLLLVVGAPARRTWGNGGILVSSRPTAWRIETTGDGARIRSEAAGEVDLLELHADTAEAATRDVSEPMTVLGSFTPVAGPSTVGGFLVGDEVLDTNDFGGRRAPSEQTALSLYRIARHRGGAFWDGVAEHVAGIVARRVSQCPEVLPVHGVYGGAETHTRFLADAVLLLTAHGEHELAARALAGLDQLSVNYAGGRWTLHDSEERDAGANHLVLNTHVQSIVARTATGADIAADLRAMDAALNLRLPTPAALSTAARIAVSDMAGGWLGRSTGGRAQERAAEARRSVPHLRLPGGWIARDAGLSPAPAYLTVNIYDLASLCSNQGTPTAHRALSTALRYARVSGYFRGQQRTAHPQASVQPIALRMAGHARAAGRAADRARAAGWHPAVGWPGYIDALWPRLTEGTP